MMGLRTKGGGHLVRITSKATTAKGKDRGLIKETGRLEEFRKRGKVIKKGYRRSRRKGEALSWKNVKPQKRSTRSSQQKMGRTKPWFNPPACVGSDNNRSSAEWAAWLIRRCRKGCGESFFERRRGVLKL